MGVPADVDAAPVANQLVLPDETVELVERMLTRMKVYIHRRPDDLQRHYCMPAPVIGPSNWFCEPVTLRLRH